MDKEEIIKHLEKNGSQRNREGMARFGINATHAFGVSIPVLRKLAKEIGKNHKLANELWQSGVHEARILASMIEEIDRVTEKQADLWTKDFDSWDLCDQCCMNLFDRISFSHKKAVQWADRKREFEKRAGFALMAALASHDKKAKDSDFIKFFSLIEKHSSDSRNFVKKAVNWALRGIGKRNGNLKQKALKLAKRIAKKDSKSARWIANDAIRELKNR